MDVEGSRIMVTGATGGIGAAVVTTLAARGARLVVVGRRTAALEALAARVDGEAIVADLATADGVDELAAEVGGCDALVLNAGLLDGDPRHVLAVNLWAPMRLSAAFVAARRQSGRAGAAVFTGSVAGVAATPGMGAYNASKFGLRGYALSLAAECSGSTLTATHLVVGYVRDAGMLVDSGGRPPRWARTRSPGEVADAVVGAIEDGPAERWVAPMSLRLAAIAAASAPRLAAPVLRRVGSQAWRPTSGARESGG